MIIKTKDDHQDQVDYLIDLLERDFPDDKKSLIERELKNLYSGNKGEATSTHYLDVDFGKSNNWALIHDLRIEFEGDVAQIDHLLIGRMMDIYVIESKNFSYGVSISDEGDFSYFYKNRPYSIPSPILQNERHIRLLDQFLTNSGILPKRLGTTLKPTYRNIVLVSPDSRLTKPKTGTYDCSMVMKSDKFLERFRDDAKDDSISSVINLAKVISPTTLGAFAEKLAVAHTPTAINYLAKLGLDESVEKKDEAISGTDASADSESPPKCPKCDKEMVKRSAKKGKNAGAEFWGCSDFPTCRGTLAIDTDDENNAKNDAQTQDTPSPLCPNCDGDMVKRVSKKGANAGKAFWGCQKFPKCRGTVAID
ncbi:topoisomerase DNA-binding C4 zinc finger domain-containing protein [Pseudomonadota bacterium]